MPTSRPRPEFVKILVFFGIGLLFLGGCATPVPCALDRIKPGMDKDNVLEEAGNPTRTFREKNLDNWIYVYFQHDQQWLRDVIFSDGKVLSVTHPTATKEAWVKELERAETMEEYERKAREHQKNNSSGQ